MCSSDLFGKYVAPTVESAKPEEPTLSLGIIALRDDTDIFNVVLTRLDPSLVLETIEALEGAPPTENLE